MFLPWLRTSQHHVSLRFIPQSGKAGRRSSIEGCRWRIPILGGCGASTAAVVQKVILRESGLVGSGEKVCVSGPVGIFRARYCWKTSGKAGASGRQAFRVLGVVNVQEGPCSLLELSGYLVAVRGGSVSPSIFDRIGYIVHYAVEYWHEAGLARPVLMFDAPPTRASTAFERHGGGGV